MGRIAGRFSRVEPRRRARQLVLGVLSDLPRKNCWTIAEHTGDATPDGLQHLLGRVKWDADRVRDDLRDFVLEHLADDQAVLVDDETGDLKKGTQTVGIQRPYTGTGFPGHFFINYHLYPLIFPLQALGRFVHGWQGGAP